MSRRFACADEVERERGLAAALSAVREGDLIVMPTDTVYGIAADAFDPDAVRRLLRAKGRGREMPPPVLVSSATTLDALATDVPAYVRELVDACWPGPLTVICHQQPSLSWDLGESHGTVAVRMPDDELALELIAQTGPLAVSSANTTGQPPAQSADEAEDMLGQTVEVYLDGGRTSSDVPSTILDVTGVGPRVVRDGAISRERLRDLGADLPGDEDALSEEDGTEDRTEEDGTEDRTEDGTEDRTEEDRDTRSSGA